MRGPAFGIPTPHILVVRLGHQTEASACLPPGAGFQCQEIHWPSGGHSRTLPGRPDLIILDFPATDSMDFSVCPKVKSITGGVPVIVIGADVQTDRIVSLELGADDYLSKPFHPKELAARARAILRSCGQRADETSPFSRISGKWMLDHAQRRLIASDGTATKLNTVEYWLLVRFMERPDIIMSRENLAAYLHDRQSVPYTPLSIIVFVNGLREKLEDISPFSLIRTVRGQGYVYTGRR